MLLKSSPFGTKVKKQVPTNPRNNVWQKEQDVVDYRFLCTELSDEADIDFSQPIVSKESQVTLEEFDSRQYKVKRVP